jgi:hypothetical protein
MKNNIYHNIRSNQNNHAVTRRAYSQHQQTGDSKKNGIGKTLMRIVIAATIIATGYVVAYKHFEEPYRYKETVPITLHAGDTPYNEIVHMYPDLDPRVVLDIVKDENPVYRENNGIIQAGTPIYYPVLEDMVMPQP